MQRPSRLLQQPRSREGRGFPNVGSETDLRKLQEAQDQTVAHAAPQAAGTAPRVREKLARVELRSRRRCRVGSGWSQGERRSAPGVVQRLVRPLPVAQASAVRSAGSDERPQGSGIPTSRARRIGGPGDGRCQAQGRGRPDSWPSKRQPARPGWVGIAGLGRSSRGIRGSPRLLQARSVAPLEPDPGPAGGVRERPLRFGFRPAVPVQGGERREPHD
jgi:hypothetical protein